jgi:two-component system OmpR family sensor kinase
LEELTALRVRLVGLMSLRLRLAVLVAVVAFAVVALFGTGVYVVLSTRLYGETDASLQQYAGLIVHRVNRPPATLETPTMSRILIGESDSFAIAYDGDGHELARSPNAAGLDVPLPPAAQAQALMGNSSTATVGHRAGAHYRLTIVPVTGPQASAQVDPGPGPLIISVGKSLDPVDSTLQTLRLILLAGGGLALLSALLLAWIVAGRGLHPVTQLTRAAETIGPDDLGERLPVPGTRDEISRLSMSFNASLDRLETVYRQLEESLNRQRQFVADASHELRTPLTVILNDAQTLLEHPEATAEQREECLAELLIEARRMARLTNDLLQLARTDADGRMELSVVDWDALFADAVEDAERICAPREVDTDARVTLGLGRTDRALVLRALRALFDNIARHTPETTRVMFSANATGDTIEFGLADTGPGVAPDVLPRIFDRFFRADPARRGHGTGLGLAISRHVVERHGGTVHARNVDGGGFGVDVSLPRWAEGDEELETTSTQPEQPAGDRPSEPVRSR